jgi:hypothetical protein
MVPASRFIISLLAAPLSAWVVPAASATTNRSRSGIKGGKAMSHYATLYSIVFMIGFVYLFDRRHHRRRFWRLLASVVLMTPEEVDLIRKIQLADEEG